MARVGLMVTTRNIADWFSFQALSLLLQIKYFVTLVVSSLLFTPHSLPNLTKGMK